MRHLRTDGAPAWDGGIGAGGRQGPGPRDGRAPGGRGGAPDPKLHVHRRGGGHAEAEGEAADRTGGARAKVWGPGVWGGGVGLVPTRWVPRHVLPPPPPLHRYPPPNRQLPAPQPPTVTPPSLLTAYRQSTPQPPTATPLPQPPTATPLPQPPTASLQAVVAPPPPPRPPPAQRGPVRGCPLALSGPENRGPGQDQGRGGPFKGRSAHVRVGLHPRPVHRVEVPPFAGAREPRLRGARS